MNRDDFPLKIKKIVAERSAYMCNNPDCRKMTIRPHSDPNKSLNDGVAAHICAAAKGGPRYDVNQTEQQRKSIENAIWLCHNCSDLVDKDEIKYTMELLLEWKRCHEDFVLKKGMMASFPEINLKTLDGFTISTSSPVKITGDHFRQFRENTLLISNQNDKPIFDLRLRIQFPEAIVNYPVVKNPPRTNISCKPEQMEGVAKATGNGSITVTGISKEFENYIIEIDELFPKNSIEVKLLSKEKRLKNSNEEIMENNSGEKICYHILGSYQYEWQSTFFIRKFLVPLRYNPEKRQVSSLSCKEIREGQNLVMHYRFL